MLRLLSTLKKRIKFKYGVNSRFSVHARQDKVNQVSGFAIVEGIPKRLTIETEDAIYEYIFPGLEPLDGSAVSARPTRLIGYSRNSAAPQYSMVENVDQRDDWERGKT